MDITNPAMENSERRTLDVIIAPRKAQDKRICPWEGEKHTETPFTKPYRIVAAGQKKSAPSDGLYNIS